MKEFWVTFHRWAGITTGIFLISMGLSGALLSWGFELDAWLNPELYKVQPGPTLDPFDLAARVEAQVPEVKITSLPLEFVPGHAAIFDVRPALNPETGKPFKLDYFKLWADPVTGQVLGHKSPGRMGLDRQHLMPTVYEIHHSFGFGPEYYWYIRRLEGALGLAWAVNCLVGLYVSMPKLPRRLSIGRTQASLDAGPPRVTPGFLSRWKPAWKINFRHGAYRVAFDAHRAFALWLFLLLFLQAASTMVTMQFMQRNVVLPTMALFGSIQSPTPFVGTYADLYAEGPFGIGNKRPPPQKPVAKPALDFAAAVGRAQEEAARLGWSDPLGRVLYSGNVAAIYTGNASVYRVRFFPPGADERLTPNISSNAIKELDIDGVTGDLVGKREPFHGTVADFVIQEAFPIHSGLAYGYWGRIVASVMGAGTVMLAVTGYWIWLRKRHWRLKKPSRSVRAVPSGSGKPLAAE
jgi:uncharacterized iron-regulated membrane protein